MKFLEYDSPVQNVIGKTVDFLWVSLMWFVCSIPIITIGTATTALYYSSVKCLRKNREYPTRTFLHAFKMNLKASTLVWIIYLVISIILYGCFVFTGTIQNSSIRFLVGSFYLCIAFFVLATGCYVFPVISRCSMRTGEYLRFAAGLAIKHFPYTLIMVVIVLGCVAAMWYFPLTVFCVPAIGSIIFSYVMENILKRYTPESDQSVWYKE